MVDTSIFTVSKIVVEHIENTRRGFAGGLDGSRSPACVKPILKTWYQVSAVLWRRKEDEGRAPLTRVCVLHTA